MNMGDCAGLSSRTVKRHGSPFRCPPSDKLAGMPTSSVGHNAYPWRDSFCETRGYWVGQCPAGIGHQGQDIVPVDCRLSSQDMDHCDRIEHRIVAVHDGMVLRSPGQEGLVLTVNAPDTHLRFRYLHMNPRIIDQEGFVSGRVVRQGETIGRVGNYSGREGGTSYHLHFDMQVPTKDGWVFVNPYMTLVLAYEQMIGGRGTEIQDEIKETPASVQTGTEVKASPPAPVRKAARRVIPSPWKRWGAVTKHRAQSRTGYYRI
jgi:hypothetical protein